MTHPVARLIDLYASRGLLIDANILLLYFVGAFDRQQIPRFKRTAQFTVEDYDLLLLLVSRFKGVVTTPHVLSEVNSLLGQIGDPRKTEWFQGFARGIGVLDEQYVVSAAAAEIDEFPNLGLTDSGIMRLAKDRYLVLTDDLKLFLFLEKRGIPALNFSHIRFLLRI